MVGKTTRTYLDGNGQSQTAAINDTGGAGDEFLRTEQGNALASANFTRPTDAVAYTSGDLVANSTVAGNVTPLQLTAGRLAAGPGATGRLKRARLRKTTTGTTGAQFRIHFFKASPTVANGDNGAISIAGVANWIGSIDVDMSTRAVFSDGAIGDGAPATGTEINFTVQTLYALIEARGAYTPGNAETFTLEAEIQQV